MILRVFNFVITLVLCALISWWFAILCNNPDGCVALAIGSFVALAVTGTGAFAIKWPDGRSGMVCRMLSYIFFFVFIILNVLFAFLTSWSIPAYLIITGVTACVFLLWVKWVYSTEM